MQNDISLAQWALVEEFRSGKIRTLDFPQIARNDFGLNGIELVNTLMEVPTQRYLDELKKNAQKNNVQIVLIMVDDEGDGCAEAPAESMQFFINHRKWIDIAKYLGCQAIRTNCRGRIEEDPKKALDQAVATYLPLLEYAQKAGIKVLIENHGGFSNDPEWMVALFRKMAHRFFGSLPDWREPGALFDNTGYLRKMVEYAGGMSVRLQPDENKTAEMIGICEQGGYKGWYGVESDGRPAIYETIRLLKKYLRDQE